MAAEEDFSDSAALAASKEGDIDSDADDRSLGDDVRGLMDDGFAAVEAEFAYQKARVSFAAQSIKSIAIFGILAAVIAFFSLVALTVGLVIALTPLLTAWGATAAVVTAYLAVAAICAFSAAARWRRMMIALDFQETSE
jgi:uncharacterized membrane protein YqjE